MFFQARDGVVSALTASARTSAAAQVRWPPGGVDMTGPKMLNPATDSRDRPKWLFRYRQIEIHVVGGGIGFGAATGARIALAREEESWCW